MINWRKPVIFFLLYITGSKIPRNLKTIRRLAKSSREEINRYQHNKLKQLLIYAHNNVPYYSRILKESYVVRDNHVFMENFYKIPVLTKDIIRKEGSNLYSKKKLSGVYENTSGGSTGEPVRFLQDRQYYDWNVATKLYFKKTLGQQDLGDHEFRLWGSRADILEGREKTITRWRNWLYNRRELNTYHIQPEKLIQFVTTLKVVKPQWIEAYAESAYEISRYLINQNIKIQGLRGILTSAGTLYPEMRETIEKGFQCPVYNRYGSREVGDMAFSCEKNEALHLCPWNHFFEIIGPDGKTVKPGKKGRIIVTSLNNYSMPIIRYDIGDAATAYDKSICSCGRSMPLIANVEGRISSIFKNRNNDLIYGSYFTQLFYHKQWVKKFQVIQKKINGIQIKYVLNANMAIEENDVEVINSAVKKVMGNDCKIEWIEVNEIPPLPSGKYIYTKNEVSNDNFFWQI